MLLAEFPWPRSKRATIYNLYRLPLNIIVVLTLMLKLGAGMSFFVRHPVAARELGQQVNLSSTRQHLC